MSVHTHENIFNRGQIGKKTNVLIGAGDSKTNNTVRGEADQRMAFKQYFTFLRLVKTGDAVEKRRLSRAVWADNAVDGLLPDLNIEIINRYKTAKAFGCVA